jgi:hypothetical protein
MPPQLKEYFEQPHKGLEAALPSQSSSTSISSSSATSSSSSSPLAATEAYGRSATLIKAQPNICPQPLPFHLTLVANFLALVVPSLFYIGPVLLSLPLVVVWFYPRLAVQIALVDIVLAFYPHQPWPAICQYFQLWYDLYNLHHNLELPDAAATTSTTHSESPTKKEHLEDSSLCIYATHPHGIIPIHGYLWAALCNQHFPKRYGFCALTDIAMRLPLLRQLMSWLSSDAASKSILLKRMVGQGQNLYILPGGVAEIFLSCPHRHVIKAPRRGMIKLALETGAVIVPTYVFGANAFHHQLATYGMELEQLEAAANATGAATTRNGPAITTVPISPSKLSKQLGQFQQSLSRKFRGGFTFFWGQYGLPMPLSNVKCCMVFGDPIEPVVGTLGQGKGCPGGKMTCQEIPHPTEAQIDELWHRYTTALVRLFDQYKAQAGYPDAKLDMV